jgi:hypothetical protein
MQRVRTGGRLLSSQSRGGRREQEHQAEMEANAARDRAPSAEAIE